MIERVLGIDFGVLPFGQIELSESAEGPVALSAIRKLPKPA
jgi:hypothetical protein